MKLPARPRRHRVAVQLGHRGGHVDDPQRPVWRTEQHADELVVDGGAGHAQQELERIGSHAAVVRPGR
ncbi:hypothetical protein ABZ894_29170 [Nocardia beijingensis]|uniref:hypothetical protein n=1 Tax=Nocardia beijingensis TaxID=95162 RepID=UPI0033C2E0EA